MAFSSPLLLLFITKCVLFAHAFTSPSASTISLGQSPKWQRKLHNGATSLTPSYHHNNYHPPLIHLNLGRKRPPSFSSTLALFPADLASDPITTVGTDALLLTSSGGDDITKTLAEGLGYLIGAASVLLYTPIAVRIIRKKTADGLTVSTWWLKLTSLTCTDVSILDGDS